MVLGLGWPRGVGMVKKWKWYLLTYSRFLGCNQHREYLRT